MNTTLIHLTDTHLLPDGELLHGRIDTWARAMGAFSAAAHFAPDAVVVTGDIADRGSAVHARAARLFDHAAEQLGCPVIALPGNHDPAGSVGAAFNPASTARGPRPGDTVHDVSGLRVIGLDTDGYAEPEGRLRPEQLDWLMDQLDTPAPRGTVLAMHHPPIPALLPALAGRGLADPGALAEVLAGSDVHGILCGHYHLPAGGRLGSVPVWAGPAVAYNHNPFAPADTVQGLDTSWISVVRVHSAGMTTTPVPVAAPAAVFTRPAPINTVAPQTAA
ncbi:hypothetical protein GCM10023081_42380 [Arthrobacter ginkgonis]|uniref:Calcineurin-like phosphoesterase domain-containing protein n=1 Tax=Arthrobacter ginkgonis TaxID=1630594 RepID=A0ABP7D6V9_9MICC